MPKGNVVCAGFDGKDTKASQSYPAGFASKLAMCCVADREKAEAEPEEVESSQESTVSSYDDSDDDMFDDVKDITISKIQRASFVCQ